jgi:hypothetical protein
MVREISGFCKFCGQSVLVEVMDSDLLSNKDKAEYKGLSEYQLVNKIAEQKAIKHCKCDGAATF